MPGKAVFGFCVLKRPEFILVPVPYTLPEQSTSVTLDPRGSKVHFDPMISYILTLQK